MANANHNFLKNLFTTDFPEYAKNDIFIIGESYAGIYVPTIVRELMRDPGPINLAGFAVGDGCMGVDVLCGSGNPDKGPYYTVEFLHGHGQVSERNYNTIVAECPKADLLSGNNLTPACKAALKQMEDNIGCAFFLRARIVVVAVVVAVVAAGGAVAVCSHDDCYGRNIVLLFLTCVDGTCFASYVQGILRLLTV